MSPIDAMEVLASWAAAKRVLPPEINLVAPPSAAAAVWSKVLRLDAVPESLALLETIIDQGDLASAEALAADLLRTVDGWSVADWAARRLGVGDDIRSNSIHAAVRLVANAVDQALFDTVQELAAYEVRTWRLGLAIQEPDLVQASRLWILVAERWQAMLPSDPLVGLRADQETMAPIRFPERAEIHAAAATDQIAIPTLPSRVTFGFVGGLQAEVLLPPKPGLVVGLRVRDAADQVVDGLVYLCGLPLELDAEGRATVPWTEFATAWNRCGQPWLVIEHRGQVLEGSLERVQ
jgi:hypothetical protein